MQSSPIPLNKGLSSRKTVLPEPSPSQRSQWHPTSVFLPGESHGQRSLVGCSLWGREESDTTERLHFHALEKEMATHSSVLAWRIPGMGEPGGLPSMGSHRVGHDWSDLAAAAKVREGKILNSSPFSLPVSHKVEKKAEKYLRKSQPKGTGH